MNVVFRGFSGLWLFLTSLLFCVGSDVGSTTSTLYQRYIIDSAVIPGPCGEDSVLGLEVNDSDPFLEETVIDHELNFLLAQEYAEERDFNTRRSFVSYLREKEDLVGHVLTLKNRKSKTNPYVRWKVCSDIPASSLSDSQEDLSSSFSSSLPAASVGVKGFNFNDLPVNTAQGNQPRINTSHLLFHLWPGDFKGQVDEMNKQILADNKERQERGRPVVRLVSYREMGVFLGILIVARLEGKKGSDLWVGEPGAGEGYRSQVDICTKR